MFGRNHLCLIMMAVLVGAACNRGGSSSNNNPPPGDPSLAEETSPLCVDLKKPIGAEVPDGTQAPQGFWTVGDSSKPSTSIDQSLLLMAVTSKGEISFFSDTFHSQGDRMLDCVAAVEMGVLESLRGTTSKILVSEKQIAQARANGMSEAEILKAKGSELGTLTIISSDSVSWHSPRGSDIVLQRISSKDATQMITSRIARFSKTLEARRAFAAKWVGKDLKLMKKTYLAFDKDGKELFTNVTNDSDLNETSKVTDKGREIVLNKPKRLRFLSGKEVLVNGQVKLRYSAKVDDSGQLFIDVYQQEGESTRYTVVRGSVTEREGGGLLFTHEFKFEPARDNIATSKEIYEFSL